MPVFLGGADTHRPRSSWRKFEMRVRHYGTFENFIAKSFIGLTAGVLMTFGMYFLFAFSLNFSFTGATLSCCVVGFISILGLAFSEYFRSIALLSLPSVLSGKGRQALTAYAIILAITGPGKNTLNNIRVLSDSIACSQEKLWKALKDVGNLIKNPYMAIKQSLSVVMSEILDVATKIKSITTRLKNLVLSLADVMKMAARSLDKMTTSQTRAGRTYESCMKSMETASKECEARTIYMYKGLCRSKELSKSMCTRALPTEESCFLPSSYADQILEKIQKKINAYTQRLSHLLTFKLTKSHETHYEFRKTRQVKDVLVAIATEIRGLVNSILYLFDSIAILFSFFYIFLFYSVITFRNKYLAHEWYENRYITSNLLLIEMKRIHLKKTTIFPLSRMERQKYIKINSLNLASMDAYEMLSMIVKAVALLIKLCLHMATDYGLWWLIMDCRRAVLVQTHEGMSNVEIISNKSDGVAGEIYEELTNAFQPNRFNFSTDMTSCLPEPYKPDFKRNYTIIMIGILTVVLGFLEPFGKRLKVRIMNFYCPTIARRRAVWLYNHILRTRNRFTKEARRRLRRQYGRWDLHEPESASFFYRLRSKVGHLLPCALSKARQWIIPNQHQDFCILCKVFWAPADPLTRCATPGCRGTYCLECFASLENLCTVCLRPEQYNDISDISEECDSSDEDLPPMTARPRGKRNISDEEESLTIQERDFETDSDSLTYQDTDDEMNYDTPVQLLPPVSSATNYDEKKDWATMKDFTLPDSDKEQDAIADYGISMTLALRMKKGFSGLIFAKPVFGRPLDVHSDMSRDVSTTSSEVPPEEKTYRHEAVTSPRSWVSGAKFSEASKNIWNRIRRPSSRKNTYRRKLPKSPTTGPSYCDYGSAADSRKSYTTQRSLMTATLSEGMDVFKTVRRSPKHTDRQVYCGLLMSNSQRDGIGSTSGTEEEANSDTSADYTANTRSSLRSLSVKKLSQDTSDLSTISAHEDGRSSSFDDNSDKKRRKRSHSKEDRMSSGFRKEDVKINVTDDVKINLSDTHFNPPSIEKRPSFRDIKIRPSPAQVTHKIFNVDEEDFIQ